MVRSISASVFWNSRKFWSSKSSIFQKMMISKLIRTCTSWELYRSLNLQFFKASVLQSFISSFNKRSLEWMTKVSTYRENLWTLCGLGPICLLSCWAWTWAWAHFLSGLRPLCLAWFFIRGLNWVGKLDYPIPIKL